MNAKVVLRWLLLCGGYALIALALASGGIGAWLTCAGCYPPPGTGSLGHVGMAIAGLTLWAACPVLLTLGFLLIFLGHAGVNSEPTFTKSHGASLIS